MPRKRYHNENSTYLKNPQDDFLFAEDYDDYSDVLEVLGITPNQGGLEKSFEDFE